MIQSPRQTNMLNNYLSQKFKMIGADEIYN